MKKLKTFFFLFLTLNVVFAQTDKLPKQTVDGKTVFVYKIESGDGWYSIARKFSITYSELKMANKNTDKLKVGEKLNIPSKLKSNDPYFEKNKG
ncbi:MAG: LysM peptidoglycan-binding domain-containing protein [Bacteroidetes bacterium]|nr:LysM peptidoglycan-binding domain-containing protein [Bacteroidota bacterium]